MPLCAPRIEHSFTECKTPTIDIAVIGCFYTGDELSVWANLGKLI